jgi:glutamyl/glutaminyl-tRNA synthetase
VLKVRGCCGSVAAGAAAVAGQRSDFTAVPLHDLLQDFLQQRSLKPGDLFPALRLCISGKAQGADLFRTLELLGRERVDSRMTMRLSDSSGS